MKPIVILKERGIRNSEWVRVSVAADLLGYSDDSIRRMVADGRLDATSDPDVLENAGGGRGRPPSVLISRESIDRFLGRVSRADPFDAELAGLRPAIEREQKILELEAENARLRAELAKAREVARLALIVEERAAEADRIRREQLNQYLQPDFPDV